MMPMITVFNMNTMFFGTTSIRCWSSVVGAIITVALTIASPASATSTTSSSSSDYDKLVLAISEIRNKFSSINAILDSFGILTLPIAQQYGIIFGCITFISTIGVVLLLLLFGGTFQRIINEDKINMDGTKSSMNSSSNAPATIREQRSLLYEELLDQRQRMMLRYTSSLPSTTTTSTSSNDNDIKNDNTNITELTIMLCNVIPPNANVVRPKATTVSLSSSMYESNYKLAYQTCQNRPGGSIVSGHPEVRYESYAIGYSSCSYDHCMDVAYRRSYGRMMESIICQDHVSIDYYQNDLLVHRPMDIIGTYIRLEPFNYTYNNSSIGSTTTGTSSTHIQELFHTTCTGNATMEYMKSYNPYDIWCFHDDGPFRTIDDIQQSTYLFPTTTQSRTASFVIRQNITHHFLGIIQLCNDEPEHLCIQIQIPIMVPKYSLSNLLSCKECIEGYFLLLDRLFAYGYRRIYCMIDTQDIYSIQFITKLGFTYEGSLYKHRIVKNANRNSNIYAILNSDWKQTTMTYNNASTTTSTATAQETSTSTTATATTSSSSSSGTSSTTNYHYGARAALFKKLYGITKFRADISNEQHETEEDHKVRVLSEQQQQSKKKV